MAVDFNILARVPTIGSQIMAGQEAGREAAARNMLLQQRALEFKQAQEDRKLAMDERRILLQQRATEFKQAQEDRQRRLREEQIFSQAAEMIRQSGLDPEDPKVLQQFTAAAVQSRNPQLMSLATSMSERLAKRRQEQKNAAAVAAIAARRRGEAPAGAPAPAPMAAAIPMAAAAPMAVPEPAPTLPAAPTLDERGVNLAAWMAKAGLEEDVTPPPVNQLAPQAAVPPVNQLAAAPAPAVQVAGPAAKPAAPKVDVDKLQKQLDDLQEDYDEYSGLGTEEGRKAAAALKPQMGRLERQIRDANKTKESQSPLMRDVVAFGFEPTADGLAKFEAAKRDPDTVGTKEYNLAVKQGFKGSLFDYKKQLAEATRSVTNVSMSTEKKYGEQFAGKVAERDDALWNAAQDAPAQAENANRILSTLATGKAITGPLADVKLNIARALNVVGVDNADTISKTEALVTSMAQNTLNAVKTSGLGAAQGFTDKDLEFLQQAKSGNINFQPDTIRYLAELAHRAAEKTAEKWNARVKQIPKSALEGTGVSTEPIKVPKRASSVTAATRPSGVGPDWTLMQDANGKKAWVSPDRKQVKEVD